MAEAAGVDAHDIEEPLYDAVDPDALDDVVRSADATAGPEVSFTLAGHRVTVTVDEIAVRRIDA